MDNRNIQILNILPGANGKHKRYECKCNDCGREFTVTSNSYKVGKGCLCKKHLYNDLTGKTIGKIQVLKLIVRAKDTGKKKRGHIYKCKCKHCNKEHDYHSATISRKGFLGCRCNIKDINHAAKKKVYKAYQASAKKRNISFKLTFEEVMTLCSQNCWYCGSEPSNISTAKDILGTFKYNGIDRKDNNKGYFLKNALPACKTCNWMKKKMTVKEFTDHVGKAFKHLLQKR